MGQKEASKDHSDIPSGYGNGSQIRPRFNAAVWINPRAGFVTNFLASLAGRLKTRLRARVGRFVGRPVRRYVVILWNDPPWAASG
ncbi:MAG: hypothetical protein NO474_05025 [Methanomassiliicoccales archaeon]|nr:hypothetical protein [Methanomassiliicoccales archaeon]